MAQYDTGLGWSAKSEYLLEANLLFGTLRGGLDTRYIIPQKLYNGGALPTTGEMVMNGLYIGDDANGNARYLMCDVSTNAELKIAYVVGFQEDGGYYINFLVSETAVNAAVGQPRFFTYTYGDQNVSYTYGGYITALNSATGMYYRNIVFAWVDNPAWGPVHYPTSGDAGYGVVISSLLLPGIDCYKLNSGWAVTCFASWLTPDGAHLVSPILISTIPLAAVIGTAPSTPADPITTANFLYEGVTFYISILPGKDADVYTAASSYPILPLEQFGAAELVKLFRLVISESMANVIVITSPDPYSEEGGNSEEGGADGEEDSEDNVDFTEPPSTSIGATGLLTIFCPNLYQLQSLGNYMWSTFDVDNWRKIIANPMDAILGLHTIPIPAIITGTKPVKVAGIDTTIDMSYTTVRYIRRSLGTCEIPKKWGAYLDYSPYTKISIFLPFIGFKELDADDVMGKTIALQYMIDILTGACVAELKCGNTVLYSWSGNCANEVPISGSDWRGAIASAIGIAATVAGTALVTGGATAPMAASMVASVGANSMNLKPTINRSGAISGSAGYISQKRPYIIRSIPNLVIPADQNKFIGYPSFVTTSLGSLTGYNEIASIHLEGIPATGNELSEIETLLKGGVIF